MEYLNISYYVEVSWDNVILQYLAIVGVWFYLFGSNFFNIIFLNITAIHFLFAGKLKYSWYMGPLIALAHFKFYFGIP